ncbi:electron transport complex subunit RsxC [uncultured Spongiibacter sp.]|uniref:electron transport complex subunit RsxC n=1 Tax=uncultured Spongiibacter sp. TaxID=870896 RepID=UPI0025917982|nr:electron transport complex subunit RsxC [uncultured Spongiibacter sp.]
MTAATPIRIWDIPGGTHPAENKTQSLGHGIEIAPLPALLTVPLQQHLGGRAEPCVSVGDTVLKGQMIAEASSMVSCPVHAPTSGTVTAIGPAPYPHASGLEEWAIHIEADGEDRWCELQPVTDFRALEPVTLLELIRQAGISGLGGAGFPTAVKLKARPEQKLHTLIINGTECEPYITADDSAMRYRAPEIITGIEILMHVLQPEQVLIGIEDNKPEALAVMQKAAEGTGIEIVSFPTKYPSGGEKQLIQILTGREVPSGGLPADIGVVCQNIGTARAIYRAVSFGEPLISRITTVTGNAVAQPRNYEVLIGTPVQYLLEQSAFNQQQCIRLIMGGPMMGYTLQDTAVPVVKTSNCILAPTVEELPPPPPAQACIRCGMCAEACPVSLLPQQMYWFSRAQEHDKLEEHNLFDCIECGACSYACPSNIPLVQYYRASKAEIRQAEQDKIKSERSKERFEARQARIEREAAEKEAKRKARLEAAKAKASAATKGDDKTDLIQAAIERSKAKKAGTEAAPTDPAQAAIARAQAKRDGNAPEESPAEKTTRLENVVASSEKRLKAAKEKLQLAEANGDDKVDAFRTAVEKTDAKLAAAKQELEAHLAKTEPQAATAEPAADLDPAAAAIARAQAKRAGGSEDETPEAKIERLNAQIDSTTKRLSAAEDKLAAAKAEGDDKVDAFATAVEKTQSKLDKLKAELAEIQGAEADAPTSETATEPAASDDPAAQAIARAMAARAANADLSEADKAANNVASLEKRLAKAEQKLAEAQAAGDDSAEILADSLSKLQDKLTAARQTLDALREEQK